jgi:hypothetical protein
VSEYHNCGSQTPHAPLFTKLLALDSQQQNCPPPKAAPSDSGGSSKPGFDRPALWSVDTIEHTFGEQVGEQIEGNREVSRNCKLNESGPLSPTETPLERLWSRRSGVRVPSLTLQKTPRQRGFFVPEH